MIAGGVVLLFGAGWGVSKLMPSRGDAAASESEAQADKSPADQSGPIEVVDEGTAFPVDTADAAGLTESEPGILAVEPEPEVAVPEPEPAGPQRDCDTCPVVAAIPGGTFMMGSPDSESGRVGNEGPLHSVTLAPFVMSRS